MSPARPAQGGQVAADLSVYPWLYLRDAKLVSSAEHVVEVVAVGDVMLGRGVIREERPFGAVDSWLRAADLVLGNLESVVASGGALRPGPYRLRAPVSAAGMLREAGFDILSLANNHALDAGPAGLEEMVDRLEREGMATTGAGPDGAAAAQPLLREVDGVRLAFLAFNDVPDPGDASTERGWTRATWDSGGARAAIASARARADGVIVSVHWGYEYELRADPSQRVAAQAMLDAGADLIVGHHPHVVQGVQLSLQDGANGSGTAGGRIVAYSLGNFVFDQQQGETQQGLALRALFDEQGLRAVQAVPVRAGPHPTVMTLDQAAGLLGRVTPTDDPRAEPAPEGDVIGLICSAPWGPDGEGCQPVDAVQATGGERFRAGSVDLTGDGVPEEVRRIDDQVLVYRDGVEVWRGLPEWRVVDLALGDPNDDGRGEMLLALWKPDGPANGGETSHPFVVGYRSGAYRIVWGGSPVAEPIHEVELGDVDGDGVQELVVLADQADGPGRTVSVWRWHGWGFSLLWRSPPGPYCALGLHAGQDHSLMIVSTTLCATVAVRQ